MWALGATNYEGKHHCFIPLSHLVNELLEWLMSKTP